MIECYIFPKIPHKISVMISTPNIFTINMGVVYREDYKNNYEWEYATELA